MKKDARTVEDMVMRAHYLEALDMESRAGESLSDMERKEFIDTIKSLKETIESLKTSMEAMKESYSDNTETLRLTIKDLRAQLDAITKERDDLRAMLSRINQERFGSKSLKKSSRKVSGNSKPDREQEKDDFASKKEDGKTATPPRPLRQAKA